MMMTTTTMSVYSRGSPSNWNATIECLTLIWKICQTYINQWLKFIENSRQTTTFPLQKSIQTNMNVLFNRQHFNLNKSIAWVKSSIAVCFGHLIYYCAIVQNIISSLQGFFRHFEIKMYANTISPVVKHSCSSILPIHLKIHIYI